MSYVPMFKETTTPRKGIDHLNTCKCLAIRHHEIFLIPTMDPAYYCNSFYLLKLFIKTDTKISI